MLWFNQYIPTDFGWYVKVIGFFEWKFIIILWLSSTFYHYLLSEFGQLVQQIQRIQQVQRMVLGQEEGGEGHGAPAVTTAASTSSTAPGLFVQ